MKSKVENKRTFDEVIRIAVQPKERAFTALLNDKQPVYPKQPRARKDPKYLKEEIGISVASYKRITIVYDKEVLGDRTIQVKLLKIPKRDEFGNITKVDFYIQEIDRKGKNPFVIQLPSESKFNQVIFTMEKPEDSENTSEVNLEVRLTY